jgi:hypothetical protein
VGLAAMLVGAVDLMEGSLLILPGSALVALGTFLGPAERRFKVYRLVVFVLVAVGVSALWLLSMAGGFGGPSGLPMWWGLWVVPYLVGWVMGVLAGDSPRWAFWLGLLVGCWYLAVVGFLSMMPAQPTPEMASAIPIVQMVLGITGLVTIGGAIYRIRRRV